ncbi:S41 family peptidase [Clostridium grantii]|uniref:Carboxyl-terminal processing protease n=1 Tax=Clostridium grantii DSM 8605 TaxID=1121316 RepID=A0A1M5RKP2_9CLOT|nr:S41 family peptidase [Clostridium grantii]SHH26932.1 carboxyl-terminal processing protease [Clostridium grantii DSM 8605]
MKFKNKFNIFISVLTLVCLLNTTIINAVTYENLSSENNILAAEEVVSNKPDEVLEEVKTLVKKYFVHEYSEEDFKVSTVDELIKNLNDPYTSYFTKQEYDEFINSLDNKFCGVGINVEMADEGVLVISVIEGSSAEEIGIESGDIIIKADDFELSNIAIEEAITKIRGEEGTSVHLYVKRGSEIFEFDAIRKVLRNSTVTSKIFNDNIGYIGITTFGDETEKDFISSMNNLQDNNIEKLIVDLRYNPGGWMDSATDIAGYFVGYKNVLNIEDKDKQVYKIYSKKYDKIFDKPVIFLINEYSASSSEILSAAVKDYGKAFFIGKTTYGKGVAQSLFSLSNGGFLKLTTLKFYSPMGNIIQDIGVKENFTVDNKIDSLYVAILLNEESKENLTDKSGYVKIKIDGKLFYINLNEARKKENWEAYKYIIEKTNRDDIYIGKKDLWVKSDENFKLDAICFYPEAVQLKTIEKATEDKEFTINFSKKVKVSTANKETIKLLDISTGQEVKYDFISTNNQDSIKLRLQEELKKGKSYYLIVDKEIQSSDAENLDETSLTKLTVK